MRLDHVPALDGLRGLAVAGVVAFHGGYLDGGWLGVDLFLVLSGYLITSLLLLEDRRRGGIDLVGFWGRRARRLLPALLAVLVAVALFSRWELGPVEQGVARADGLATLGFVANWHDVVDGASYWDRGAAPSLLAHTWSLAVEEQLYVLWPVAVGLALARRRRPSPATVVRLGLAVAGASAGLALALHAWGASDTRIYEGTDTRAVAVGLGAAVAGWRRRPGRGDRQAVRHLERVAMGAAVVLAAAWWGLSGSSVWTYRGGLLVASVAGAVVVAAAADPRAARLASVLSLRPLTALGTISYGLYLWHWPVFQVLDAERTGIDGIGLFAARVVVAVALASASWSLLERPIRAGRPDGWWTGRRGVLTAVAGMAVVAGLLVAGTPRAGSDGRAELASRTGTAEDRLAGAPTVVVVGDSVAAVAAQWPIADPAGFGVDVVRNTGLGCRVIADGVHRIRDDQGEVSVAQPCTGGVRALVEAERPAASVVLFGGWVNGEVELDGTFRSACEPEYRAWFQARMYTLVEDLASTGAPVVVATAARSTTPFQPGFTAERTDCANDALADLVDAWSGRAEVALADLDGWLCPAGACRDEVDGEVARPDGLHPDGPGGRAVATWLFTEVAHLAGYTPVPTA